MVLCMRPSTPSVICTHMLQRPQGPVPQKGSAGTGPVRPLLIVSRLGWLTAACWRTWCW